MKELSKRSGKKSNKKGRGGSKMLKTAKGRYNKKE